MNLFVFLLIGVVAGWLAGRIMKGRGFGLAGDLIKRKLSDYHFSGR